MRSALRLLLHELGLAYVIEDEVLLATTTEAAESKLAAVIYPVTDLVMTPGRDQDANGPPDFEALAALIHSIVQPTTWDEVGGPGSLASASAGKAHLLIISQTQEVHEEIAVLLAGLRQAEASTPGSKDACRSISLRKRTPAIEKIVAALASPTQLEFVDKPLTGVVDYLKGRHHIDIQLDKKAMDEAGIGADVPATRNLKGVSLRLGLAADAPRLGPELRDPG